MCFHRLFFSVLHSYFLWIYYTRKNSHKNDPQKLDDCMPKVDMDEFKRGTTSLLQDHQNDGVGPDSDASFTLQNLNISLSAKSATSSVSSSPNGQHERGNASAFNRNINHFPPILKRSLVSQSSQSDLNSTSRRSFNVSLNDGVVDRSLSNGISDNGASKRGLSVRFADSDHEINLLPSSPAILGSSRETNPSHFDSLDVQNLQRKEPPLHCSETVPIIIRDCLSDPCSPNGSPSERNKSTRRSRFFNVQDGRKAPLPRSRTQSNSFSFPLENSSELCSSDWLENYSPQSQAPHKPKFYSEPLPQKARENNCPEDRSKSGPMVGPKIREGKPENFQLFRTKSERFNPKLQKNFSRLQSRWRGKVQESDEISESSSGLSRPRLERSLPAGRYFAALQGPELEDLKACEEVLLPLDQQWPFLLRFPISSFGISLGLGSQTMLWKNIALTPSMHLLHVPKTVNLVLWCLALVALVITFSTYILKCIFYFEAVYREFHHPVRVNFFFAPWIAAMFLTIGVPPIFATSIHPALWCVFITPLILLELKIYGQWLSGGERRLSKVANPSTHLSIVGNFIGAILGATVGWKEPATFFWAVGLAHYLVVFVTLYQRLPTNETLPKDLHPVFFLFVAAPSAASVAWEKIIGDFDYVSRIVYFVSIFLLASLIARINFFRGFRFSISWWAYTFPLTAASIATIRYSQKVTTNITQVMAISFSLISSTIVLLLFMSTFFHFWLGTLFPNDLAIAITTEKKKSSNSCHKEDIEGSLNQNGQVDK